MVLTIGPRFGSASVLDWVIFTTVLVSAALGRYTFRNQQEMPGLTETHRQARGKL